MQALLLQYFLLPVCFFTQTTRTVYVNLQGADALQVRIVQRTKHIAKVGFT